MVIRQKKDIIKCCRLDSDNKEIIVNYLDGSTYKIPFVEEDYKNILNKMLKQAIERNDNIDFKKLEEFRNEAIVYSIVFIIVVSILSGFSICLQDDENLEVLFLYGTIFGLGSVSTAICGGIGQKELNELKKYSIYLNFKDNFEENCDDPNIFNGIKSKEKELNINTLDNFLLKDIRKINENLNKSKEYKHYITRTRK